MAKDTLCRFLLEREKFEWLKNYCEDHHMAISELLQNYVDSLMDEDMAIYGHIDEKEHGHHGHTGVNKHGHDGHIGMAISKMDDLPTFDPFTGLPVK